MQHPTTWIAGISGVKKEACKGQIARLPECAVQNACRQGVWGREGSAPFIINFAVDLRRQSYTMENEFNVQMRHVPYVSESVWKSCVYRARGRTRKHATFPNAIWAIRYSSVWCIRLLCFMKFYIICGLFKLLGKASLVTFTMSSSSVAICWADV